MTDLPAELVEPPVRHPLYPQLLRLQHVHPNAWQRAVLGEGMILVGALLALADLASAWSMLVLPVAVAGVVKAHDVVAGALPSREVVEPAVVPEVERPGSEALWALIAEGQRRGAERFRAGELAPFALLDIAAAGPVEVAAPTSASVLTPDEQARALTAGLRAVGASEAAPSAAVLVFHVASGVQVAAYEPALAGGLLVAGDAVLSAELPRVHAETTKAPAP